MVYAFFGTEGLYAYDFKGKLAWKAQLDLYGRAQADVMRTRCPWRWPGQYEDEGTGLYYNRFRYYEPNLGLFLTPQFRGKTIVSPSIYAKIYKAAYAGIKAGNPLAARIPIAPTAAPVSARTRPRGPTLPEAVDENAPVPRAG